LFRKILIANRGEIALRILFTCRELGISTVAVYSTADRTSSHVTCADEAVCIGPPPASASYLDIRSVLSAAQITGAEAVHPGYGFLAENAHFAEVLAECGIGWIGPDPPVMRQLGDKVEARKTAERAGVPVLPGSAGALEDVGEAQEVARDVGFPVMLKAAAGGGGRGMRVVERMEEIRGHFLIAREEALQAFGDGSLYLERFLRRPRHIEFQVFGDASGRVVHLGERECSLQRRHQKLMEEAPSPALDPELREQMGEAAVRLAATVGYTNAGTVEFLLDEDRRFYFMEMNTRIQVEHPVTEAVTGLDLVRLQLEVASGEPLALPAEVELRGHAIECRINAEHPITFRPSPGLITDFRTPGGPGVRVDTHCYPQYRFPPFYDSLMAKLVVWGRDRGEAVERMQRALSFFKIEGVHTTVSLHRRLLRDPDVRAGRLTTRLLERFVEATTQEVSA
jgi:acetyl-CoA carboxylase biotin carboxylase subunit